MATDLTLPALPVPRTAEPKHAFSRWMRSGGAPGTKSSHEHTDAWYRVLWLTGVDYFSTLGYQPGIALLAAGALSPFATGILVLVTLLGAVPVYSQVAARSFAGQGSIAMLENLLSGWSGKVFVLVLLGFAATDFIITMTLSAADAALHAVENPILHPYVGDHQFGITLLLLAILAVVFLRGFQDAVRIAIAIAVPYIVLNFVVLLRGVYEIATHPAMIENWKAQPELHGDWTMLLVGAALTFPKLALGMSGFETGVAVMPHVAGDPKDADSPVPHGRIRATRKLLWSAAVIMSILLLLSSFVTSLMIRGEAYHEGGAAAGRAIAYLSHQMLGDVFGSAYDLFTVLVLWFAGASAMAGLLNLIPRYLPRFGMAPMWTLYRRPLVLVLFGFCLLVTWIFDANVEAQGSAYATGVLVLMLSAAFAVALALWREAFAEGGISRVSGLSKSIYFWIITAVFAYTLVDNVIGRPAGALIAGCFILTILVLGAISRIRRATELRVSEIRLADEDSAKLWSEIVGRKVHLVPMKRASAANRERKATTLRHHYKIEGRIAFLQVHLMDNRSEFLAPLTLRVTRFEGDVVLHVTGANAVANTIAYMSELIDPISLFVGLTGRNLMEQAARYLLWGEGEIGLMVYKILLRYWDWTPEDDLRPTIVLMSEGSFATQAPPKSKRSAR
jgi:hypothetical protein